MKKSILWGGMAALALLFSCNKSELTDDGPKVTEDMTTAYATIRISMANTAGTRGPGDNEQDFAYGTDEENVVKSVLLLFYDVNGNLVGTADDDFVEADDSPVQSGDNIARIYEREVEVALVEGASMPTKVIAIINASDASDLALNQTALYDKSRNTSIQDHTNGFSMNNSGYYEGGEYQYATTVPEGALHKKDDHDGAPVVDIYVERVEAKVTVSTVETVNAVKDIYNADGEAVELVFVPGGWNVTATAKDTYIMKHMRESASDFTTWRQGNQGENNLTWMTDGAGFHRSYWARSYNYDAEAIAANFPVTGSVGGEGTGEFVNGKFEGNYDGNYMLNYISGDSEGYKALGNGTNAAAAYVLENTFRANRMVMPLEGAQGHNPWAVTTSVIIKGVYEIDGDPIDQTEYADGFYVRSAYKYIEDENTTRLVNFIYPVTEGDVALLEGMLNGVTFAVPFATTAEGEIDPDDLEVVYFKTRTTAGGDVVENAANIRFIQIKAGTTIYVQKEDEEGNLVWEEAEASDFGAPVGGEAFTSPLEGANYLMRSLGYARLYALGEAFFYVPLRHHIYSITGSDTPATAQYLPLGEIYTGSYGIVRNNWYDLTINSISGLGVGIADPNDILLPDPDETQTFEIQARLNVLQWHMRSQAVDL